MVQALEWKGVVCNPLNRQFYVLDGAIFRILVSILIVQVSPGPIRQWDGEYRARAFPRITWNGI